MFDVIQLYARPRPSTADPARRISCVTYSARAPAVVCRDDKRHRQRRSQGGLAPQRPITEPTYRPPNLKKLVAARKKTPTNSKTPSLPESVHLGPSGTPWSKGALKPSSGPSRSNPNIVFKKMLRWSRRAPPIEAAGATPGDHQLSRWRCKIGWRAQSNRGDRGDTW